jgi:hypothetical protein
MKKTMEGSVLARYTDHFEADVTINNIQLIAYGA